MMESTFTRGVAGGGVMCSTMWTDRFRHLFSIFFSNVIEKIVCHSGFFKFPTPFFVFLRNISIFAQLSMCDLLIR